MNILTALRRAVTIFLGILLIPGVALVVASIALTREKPIAKVLGVTDTNTGSVLAATAEPVPTQEALTIR